MTGISSASMPILAVAILLLLEDGALVVVEELKVTEMKTKFALALLARWGIVGKAVLVDVAVDENLLRSVSNIPGISLVASARLTAREVIDAHKVVATKSAIERLQEALA